MAVLPNIKAHIKEKGDRKAGRDHYSNFSRSYSAGHNVDLDKEAKRLKTAVLAAPLELFTEGNNPFWPTSEGSSTDTPSRLQK